MQSLNPKKPLRVPDLVLVLVKYFFKKSVVSLSHGRTEKSLFFDLRPGEEGGWGHLGQFQRHMVGGGVNPLGGRRGGVGCGF